MTGVQVGIAPPSLAVDFSSNTIHVANPGSNSVSAINGTTDRVENTGFGKLPSHITVDDG